ncbi:MAG TPA: redoxin domain-containing protein [Pirellulaceae bacterium]|nr:redoxin domain-containing protein [Pirellulaceae bacterium]
MLNQLSVVILVASWLFGSIVHESHAQEDETKSYPVLSGVGLALNAKEGRIYVGKVVPKSPADESGLIREGARLVSVEVDGKETSLDGKTVGEAASLIRGPVGTELVLTAIPSNDGAAIQVTLKRAPLEIAGVSDATYNVFIGKPMPELKLTSLDGTQSSQLADYRGKVVVLDFWASWCPTCYPPVSKMQTIITNNPRWKGKVELITVTVDSELSKAVGVIDKKKWNNTLNRAVDIKELNAVGVSVIPVVIIIARDGTIATMAGAHALDIEKEVVALLDK